MVSGLGFGNVILERFRVARAIPSSLGLPSHRCRPPRTIPIVGRTEPVSSRDSPDFQGEPPRPRCVSQEPYAAWPTSTKASPKLLNGFTRPMRTGQNTPRSTVEVSAFWAGLTRRTQIMMKA